MWCDGDRPIRFGVCFVRIHAVLSIVFVSGASSSRNYLSKHRNEFVTQIIVQLAACALLPQTRHLESDKIEFQRERSPFESSRVHPRFLFNYQSEHILQYPNIYCVWFVFAKERHIIQHTKMWQCVDCGVAAAAAGREIQLKTVYCVYFSIYVPYATYARKLFFLCLVIFCGEFRALTVSNVRTVMRAPHIIS